MYMTTTANVIAPIVIAMMKIYPNGLWVLMLNTYVITPVFSPISYRSTLTM